MFLFFYRSIFSELKVSILFMAGVGINFGDGGGEVHRGGYGRDRVW